VESNTPGQRGLRAAEQSGSPKLFLLSRVQRATARNQSLLAHGETRGDGPTQRTALRRDSPRHSGSKRTRQLSEYELRAASRRAGLLAPRAGEVVSVVAIKAAGVQQGNIAALPCASSPAPGIAI
jgi:hypothetical protein